MCGRTEFSIAASLAGALDSVEIAPRETRELGPYSFRNAASLNDTCEDSGPLAVWVAWRAR